MRITNNGIIEHKCKAYRGKIKDVSFRPSDNTIRCRACNDVLTKEEIDPKIFEQIRIQKGDKLNRNYGG